MKNIICVTVVLASWLISFLLLNEENEALSKIIEEKIQTISELEEKNLSVEVERKEHLDAKAGYEKQVEDYKEMQEKQTGRINQTISRLRDPLHRRKDLRLTVENLEAALWCVKHPKRVRSVDWFKGTIVEVFGDEVTDDDLTTISKLKNFKRYEFRGCKNITADGLLKLKGSEVTNFWIENCRMTKEDITKIHAAFPKLTDFTYVYRPYHNMKHNAEMEKHIKKLWLPGK